MSLKNRKRAVWLFFCFREFLTLIEKMDYFVKMSLLCIVKTQGTITEITLIFI